MVSGKLKGSQFNPSATDAANLGILAFENRLRKTKKSGGKWRKFKLKQKVLRSSCDLASFVIYFKKFLTIDDNF